MAEMEPDQDRGWCARARTLVSGLVLILAYRLPATLLPLSVSDCTAPPGRATVARPGLGDHLSIFGRCHGSAPHLGDPEKCVSFPPRGRRAIRSSIPERALHPAGASHFLRFSLAVAIVELGLWRSANERSWRDC
jgi:hypothetical protein